MSIYFLFQKQNCRLRQKKWPPTKRKKVSNRLKKIVNEYFQFEEKDAKYEWHRTRIRTQTQTRQSRTTFIKPFYHHWRSSYRLMLGRDCFRRLWVHSQARIWTITLNQLNGLNLAEKKLVEIETCQIENSSNRRCIFSVVIWVKL